MSTIKRKDSSIFFILCFRKKLHDIISTIRVIVIFLNHRVFVGIKWWLKMRADKHYLRHNRLNIWDILRDKNPDFFLIGLLAERGIITSHWSNKALLSNQCPFVYSLMKWHDKIDSSAFRTRAKSAMWVIDHSCQLPVRIHCAPLKLSSHKTSPMKNSWYSH